VNAPANAFPRTGTDSSQHTAALFTDPLIVVTAATDNQLGQGLSPNMLGLLRFFIPTPAFKNQSVEIPNQA